MLMFSFDGIDSISRIFHLHVYEVRSVARIVLWRLDYALIRALHLIMLSRDYGKHDDNERLDREEILLA